MSDTMEFYDRSQVDDPETEEIVGGEEATVGQIPYQVGWSSSGDEEFDDIVYVAQDPGFDLG